MILKFKDKNSLYKVFYTLETLLGEIASKLKIDISNYKDLDVIEGSYSEEPISKINVADYIHMYNYSVGNINNVISIPLPWREYDSKKDLLIELYLDGKLVDSSEYSISIDKKSISLLAPISGKLSIIRTTLEMPDNIILTMFNINRYSIDIDSSKTLKLPWNITNLDLFIKIYYNGILLEENSDYTITNSTLTFKENKNGKISIIRYFNTGD